MKGRFRGILLLLMALWVIGLTALYAKNIPREEEPPPVPVTDPGGSIFKQEKTIALAANQIPRTTVLRKSMFVESAPYSDDTLIPEGAIEFQNLDQYIGHFTKITGQALENLKAAGVPADILKSLESRKDQRFTKEGFEGFLDYTLKDAGGNKAEQYKSLVLKYAQYHGYFLLTDLEPGQPLVQGKLHLDRQRLMEDRTSIDMRAMSVRVDDAVAVAGFIKPYSWVDVLLTINNPQRTKTVLRNVLVLAVDNIDERDDSDNAAKAKVSVVTLQVKQEQTEILALASALAARAGKLHLSLRNPLDTGSATTKGLTLQQLLALDTPRSRRVKNRVRFIRGTSQQIKTF